MSVVSEKDVRTWLEAEDIKADAFTYEAEGDFLVVKAKEYMPTQVFDKVYATLVKQHGAKYVGGIGKNSHFRFKLETAQKPRYEEPANTELVHEGIDLIEKGLAKLREAES